MSEYQRYEFMTIDKPLTKAQLNEVEGLSSHIEASATHAIVEYHWGDFKHDPIKVLHEYFDGFLYWANWGSPRLALRFPHGALPGDIIDGYDYDDWVQFIQYPDYDILDIHFAEMEAPDYWTEYDLGSLIPIRDELMDGDLRSLYIVWLAYQAMYGDYNSEDDEEERDEDYDETEYVPPVPPGLGNPTAAQIELAALLQLPEDVVAAAGLHSETAKPKASDNFVVWVELLSEERRKDYLVRLANNEQGLSRTLAKELRELGLGKTSAPSTSGERVTYATLSTEARGIGEQREREARALREKQEREERERARLERERRLQDINNYQDTYWRQAEKNAARGSASGYDDATQVLVDLRDSAEKYDQMEQFQKRFRDWVQPHLRRPALIRRLQERKFPLTEA